MNRSSDPLLRRVLIANRGEIAIRVAKAAAGLGMESVGVYAPVDALALHTRMVTRAVEIDGTGAGDASGGGGGDAVAAYLDGAALMRIARRHGCDCVHPGYGFLAENAEFAALCAAEGLVFVGPHPATLELFGDKVRARAFARTLGIRVVPGSAHAIASADEALAQASELGYPVMLKAAAGGGGRGMRRVEAPEEMEDAFQRCRGEARAAFGDDTLFLERVIARPRHVEVQILGDAYRNVVHLHERDCSVQERHQKVLEIAPAPDLDASLRERILADATRLARAAESMNAGTVEFLVAPETGEHFFIECNPRIQVEHTVTEQVTGIDLVEAQLRIAAGASLAALGLGEQEAVPRARGFAVQARVVARGAGRLTAYKEPSGPGVRVDACGYVGYEPPPQFDPLLAKVIGSSSSTGSYTSALDRTLRALEEFHVAGLPTNLAQLRAILAHPSVRAGDARTSLLAEDPETSSAARASEGAIGGNRPRAHGETAGGPGARGASGGRRPGAGGARADSEASGGHDARRGASSAEGASAGPIALFEQQAATAFEAVLAGTPARAAASRRNASERSGTTLGASARAAQAPGGDLAELEVASGHRGVECPLQGTVVALRVREGDAVAAGDAILVASAMKMETVVTAPCAGVVVEVQALGEGDAVAPGQVVAVIAPADVQSRRSDESWTPVLDEVAALERIAHARLAPGSTDAGVVRQRSRGKLTCRERIALLLDEGTFREIGSVAGFATYDDEGHVADFTPANHVGGWGRIGGRPAVVCADDFTSRGGHSDGSIGAKSAHLDRLSIELRCAAVRMLDGSSGGGSVATMVPAQRTEGESRAKESTGAIQAGRPRVTGSGGSFLPGHLGSTMFTEQLATVPVVNLLLGSVVGIGAAKAVLGHFSVMVRDIAQLFVAGPPVVSHAMGYDVTKEELGGWHIHCRNGSVDNLAETEQEAFAMTRRFLSYLPSSVDELPPVLPPDPSDPPDRRDEELFTLIPRKRTTTFDIRRAITLLADAGSFFEIGPLWGADQVVGLVRCNGYPLGVLASDSRHPNGGAMTADGCKKLVRHLDLCDLFHVPILNLVDSPGFAVGVEHELTGTIRRGGEWMIAFAQVTVPLFTVILRRSFGVAGNNFATPQARPSVRVAWPAADVGGIPPEGGIEAAYKRQLAEAADPAALRAELEARIESARGPVGPLNKFQMEEMIDPRDTRRLICEWVENAYRVVSRPGRLVPRALQYRP